jgi:hypothetical protein
MVTIEFGHALMGLPVSYSTPAWDNVVAVVTKYQND